MIGGAKGGQTAASAGQGGVQLQDFIGYHLRRASVFDLQGAIAALEPLDLRTIPMSVLLTVVEEPGISSAEICRVLGMQRANIVPVLADLDSRGLFLREPDPSDNRIQKLFPTQKGREEAARAVALIAAHEERMLARLDAAERRQLRRLLEKVWQQDKDSKGR